MTKKDPIHDHKVMIKTLAIAQILLEQMDELHGVSCYNRELKQHTNNYKNFLERHTGKIITAQYRIDAGLFVAIQKAAKEIIDIEITHIEEDEESK